MISNAEQERREAIGRAQRKSWDEERREEYAERLRRLHLIDKVGRVINAGDER